MIRVLSQGEDQTARQRGDEQEQQEHGRSAFLPALSEGRCGSGIFDHATATVSATWNWVLPHRWSSSLRNSLSHRRYAVTISGHSLRWNSTGCCRRPSQSRCRRRINRERVPVDCPASASSVSSITSTSRGSACPVISNVCVTRRPPGPTALVPHSGHVHLRSCVAQPPTALARCRSTSDVTAGSSPSRGRAPGTGFGGKPVPTSTTSSRHRNHIRRQSIQQPERLHRRLRRSVEHREVHGGHKVCGQHHLLDTRVGSQPHRAARQPHHRMLVTVEDDPIAHPQHRTRHRMGVLFATKSPDNHTKGGSSLDEA